MAERTLAEAVADLRLSDKQFTSDLARIRAKLISAISAMEADSAVNLKVRLDEDSVLTALAELAQHAIDFAPVVKLTVDSDAVLADLAALPGLVDGIRVPVSVDTGAVVADLRALPDQVAASISVPVEADVAPATAMVKGWLDGEGNTRLDVPVDVDIAPLVAVARTIPDLLPKSVTVPIAADVAGVESDAQRIQRRIESLGLHLPVPVPLDVAGVESDADRIQRRLSDLHIDFGGGGPGGPSGPIHALADDSEKTLSDSFARAGEEGGSRLALGLGNAVKGAASAIAVTAAGFLGVSLDRGLERLNTIDDATASLKIQLGDAAAAATLLDQVLGVVSGTPFNLDQFAKAAANMVSFGIEAKKIPTYLTAIGEASASQGGRANEVAQRLSMIFGQIAVAGRVTGVDIREFSLAGVNALAILGNSFNKTSAEMQDLISRGLVPGKLALDVLSKGIVDGTHGVNGETVKFAGTMEALRLTLTGATGGFKTATARFGADFIKPFMETLVSGFNAATASLDTLGARVKKTFQGLAESDFAKNLKADLEKLPLTINHLIDSLSSVGPAVAVIGSAVGALGIGNLAEHLGPIGKLIPEALTNPLLAAAAAFAIFSPEVRTALIPIVQELGGSLKVLAGEAVDIGSKLIEALTPVVVKALDLVHSLLPLVDVLVNSVGILGAVVVPVVQVLSKVISAIPTPALVAFVGAFLALHSITVVVPVLQSIAGKLGAIGVSSERASVAVGLAATAMVGALSGVAIASEDTSTKLIGVGVAAANIGVHLASGDIVGAAVATIATAVGFVAGKFAEASRHAAELRKKIDELSNAASDNVTSILHDKDAMQAAGDAAGTTALLIEQIGTAMLDASKNGPALREALAVLYLPSTGAAGGEALVNILHQINNASGDVSKVPAIMDSLTLAFGDKTQTVVDALSGKYGEMADNLILATVATTDQEKTSLAAAQALIGQAKNIDAVTAATLRKSAADDIGFAAALRLAENSTGIRRTSTDPKQIEALFAATTDLIVHHQEVVRDELVKSAAVAAGVTAQTLADFQALADAQGIDVLTILGLDPAVVKQINDEFGFTSVAAQEAAAAAALLPAPLTAAEQAANALQAAMQRVDDTTKAVTADIALMQGHLSGSNAQQNIDRDIRNIGGEAEKAKKDAAAKKDLEKNAKTIDEIDAQNKRIAELQKEQQALIDKAALNKADLLDRIARAKAAGAVQGVALLENELLHNNDAVDKKQAEIDKAREARDKKAASLNDVVDVPLLSDTVKAQFANSDFPTLFDFLLKGPTDEAIQEWQGIIGTTFGDVQGEITRILNTPVADGGGPEAAAAYAVAQKANILAALSTTFDPATAQQIVDFLLPTDALVQHAKDSADATAVAFQAQMDARFPADAGGGGGGENATDHHRFGIVLAPPSQEESDAVKKDALDKLGVLEKQLALTSPTSHEAEVLNQQIEDLLKQVGGVRVRPILEPPSQLLVNDWVTSFVGKVLVTITATRPDLVKGHAPGTEPGSGGFGVGGSQIPPISAGFREGGVVTGENHFAHILAAGSYRTFAEPETGGEGYVPLSIHKRGRSTQIVRTIADLFGFDLVPKNAAMTMPVAVGSAVSGVSRSDADLIGAATARHMSMAGNRRSAENFDRNVHVAPGAIVVHEAKTPRRTAERLVRSLHDLTLMKDGER